MRLLALALLLTSASASAQMNYPKTEAVPLVEDHFGIKVSDPYRWLENDVRQDQKVRDWVTAENQVTEAYLAKLPARDAFKARLKTLFDYARCGGPAKKGGRYFYQHNSGRQNQSPLYVRDSVDGPGPDRFLAPEIEAAVAFVRSGAALAAAESALPAPLG